MGEKHKVLVTGAGGFIGSHLVEHLINHGFEVRAMLRYTSGGNIGNLRYLSPDTLSQLEIVRGDLKDPEFCIRSVKGCKYIFHLGALIAIPFSYINPMDYVQTNIVATTYLLNAARQEAGLERFILTSSSEVYGTAQYSPIDEKHPLNPQSPYAASKVGADKLAWSYHLSFGLPLTTIRPFNTYGPRQSERAVIPTIIRQLLSGNEVKLGNLAPKRDFLYVKDTVKGFVDVGTHPDTLGETLNLGTSTAVSIGQLLELIAKLMEKTPRVITDPERIRPENSEVYHLLANADRAMEISGWKPTYSLEAGLTETIDWQKTYMADLPSKGYQL